MTIGSSTASTGTDTVAENPPSWALVETMSGTTTLAVIADGSRPRDYTRLSRTRIAVTAGVGREIIATVTACAKRGEPQVRAVWLPDSRKIRVIAVPVSGPDTAVHAVHVWAGPSRRRPPPRPPVATLCWDVRTGVATTTMALEHLIDSDSAVGRDRALPDLMRHFDSRQPGMMAVFDRAPAPVAWSGILTTAGLHTGRQRRVRLALHRCLTPGGRDIVRAVAHDVGVADPAPAPVMAMVLRHLASATSHALGVIDLPTGLLQDWLLPGIPPVDRWAAETPEIHPDDIPVLASARASLLAGTEHLRTKFRLRFGSSDWTSVDTHWSAFRTGPRPQAMIDVKLTTPGSPDRQAIR
ncbi:GAF domain-containing protein [Nocardia sp. alder85J]|uniref:GAF domain-containing protein n=1 Tax=Nocardia sp. alder85J TaxID=2862949 RepID=UPI001CD2DC22|nr:GAF domain-containing protein [Nocardia sp. alder85J]MCX4097685.1 DUF5593 domain-containing protein [Nocardia sp. alder85J]